MSQLVKDVQIRLGNRADLQRMQALQAASLMELAITAYAPQQIKALVSSQAQSRSYYDEILVLAEIAGQLVGFGCLSQDCHQIQGLFVHPHWARQGIGSALISRIEGMAKECRVRELIVTASLAGVPFYESQGYRTLHKTGFWASDTVWIPCLEMAKYLPINPTDSAYVPANSKRLKPSLGDWRVVTGTLLVFAGLMLAQRTWQGPQHQPMLLPETTSPPQPSTPQSSSP
jgi:putative acetyltransferase